MNAKPTVSPHTSTSTYIPFSHCHAVTRSMHNETRAGEDESCIANAESTPIHAVMQGTQEPGGEAGERDYL